MGDLHAIARKIFKLDVKLLVSVNIVKITLLGQSL